MRRNNLTIHTQDVYAIYNRKSRADLDAEARGEGDTLARHRQTLIDLAHSRGLVVGEEYAEIVSGDSLANRPQMLRLLDDLSAGKWAGVLCMAIDRLGRGDSIDQGTILRVFQLSGAKIVTPAHVYDFSDGTGFDAENAEMQQFLARFELKAIKRRMWAGRCQSAKEGHWLSPRAPFGYKRVPLPNGQKGWTLEIVPEHAAAVRMAFDLYAHGQNGKKVGTRAIATIFNSMSLPTYEGRDWTSTSIHNMLYNPAYVGKVRWCRRRQVKVIEDGHVVTRRPLYDDVMIFDGCHPAIVSQEVFDEVQSISKNNHAFPRTSSGSKLTNPLAGLVICSKCGRVMNRKAGLTENHPAFLICRYPQCPTSAIHFDIVENAILSTLRDWLDQSRRPVVDSPAPAPAEDPIAIQRRVLEDQIKKLNAQKDTIMDLLEQRVYTLSEYHRRVSIITDKLASAEQSLADLPEPAPDTASAIRALAPQIQHVLDAYPLAKNADEKNALLKSVISRIIYTKDVRGNRSDSSAAFLTLDVWPVSCG